MVIGCRSEDSVYPILQGTSVLLAFRFGNFTLSMGQEGDFFLKRRKKNLAILPNLLLF
jgi:hypothetical protein